MYGNYFEPFSSDMFLINDELREFVIISIPFINGLCFIYTVRYFYSRSQTLLFLGLFEQLLARITISWVGLGGFSPPTIGFTRQEFINRFFNNKVSVLGTRKRWSIFWIKSLDLNSPSMQS